MLVEEVEGLLRGGVSLEQLTDGPQPPGAVGEGHLAGPLEAVDDVVHTAELHSQSQAVRLGNVAGFVLACYRHAAGLSSTARTQP